jgi:hypothetical protein
MGWIAQLGEGGGASPFVLVCVAPFFQVRRIFRAHSAIICEFRLASACTWSITLSASSPYFSNISLRLCTSSLTLCSLVAQGRNGGNGRNRFGRQNAGGNPAQAPPMYELQEQATGQAPPRGPAPRQRNGPPRRQVGFHPAQQQGPSFIPDTQVHGARHVPPLLNVHPGTEGREGTHGGPHMGGEPLAPGAPHAPKPRYNRRQRRGGFDGGSENRHGNTGPRGAVKQAQEQPGHV